jgi:hypothetical protein
VVKIRPCAEFLADFPDDMIEEDGEIIQFGGCNVSEAIAEILRRAGYDVSTPEYQGDHGWDFIVKSKQRRIWMQISDVDGSRYTLMSEDLSMSAFWNSNKRLYADVLERLNSELGNDPRFQPLVWLESDELLSGVAGAPSPVVEE